MKRDERDTKLQNNKPRWNKCLEQITVTRKARFWTKLIFSQGKWKKDNYSCAGSAAQWTRLRKTGKRFLNLEKKAINNEADNHLNIWCWCTWRKNVLRNASKCFIFLKKNQTSGKKKVIPVEFSWKKMWPRISDGILSSCVNKSLLNARKTSWLHLLKWNT